MHLLISFPPRITGHILSHGCPGVIIGCSLEFPSLILFITGVLIFRWVYGMALEISINKIRSLMSRLNINPEINTCLLDRKLTKGKFYSEESFLADHLMLILVWYLPTCFRSFDITSEFKAHTMCNFMYQSYLSSIPSELISHVLQVSAHSKDQNMIWIQVQITYWYLQSHLIRCISIFLTEHCCQK